MTENDRRAVILVAAGIAALALLGGLGLAAVIVLRLDTGDDVAPGIAALVMALFGIASTVVGILAPSPLSKSSTAPDAGGAAPIPVEVTNEPVGVTVEDETPTTSKRR